MRAALSVMIVAGALAGCGGGGGSGGGSPPPVQRLTLSTAQIDWAASSSGGIAAPAQISGSVSGKPAAVYAFVTYTANGIASISTPAVSGATATATVDAKPTTLLLAGTYHDTISVKACPDAACAAQFAGSPATINVTYVVGLDVSPAAITVQMVEGATLPLSSVAANYYAGTGSWTTMVTYSAGNGWLTVPASGSTLPATLNATFSVQPPGSYTANLVLQATSTGASPETRTIPVSYTVQSLLQVDAIADFSVTNSMPSTGQTRSAAVTSADTMRNSGWTATVDAAWPWLQLTSASGTTGGTSTLAVQLVPAEVSKLRNGRYVANVTLTPGLGGTTPVVVPIALVLDRTNVATVAPYMEASGRAGQVILRGAYLDSGTVTAVQFGGTAGTVLGVDSATRMRVSHPALPAGQYPVTVTIAGTVVDSAAVLVVQDAFDYTAAGTGTVPISFAWLTEFDAERHSCYAASMTQLAAVRAGPSGWTSLISPATFSMIGGLALSADGRTLVVLDATDIVELDPQTLSETHRTTVAPSGTSVYVGNLARIDDGRSAYILQDHLYAFEPWTHSASMLPFTPTVGYNLASANRTGNQIVLTEGGTVRYDILDSMNLMQSLTFSDTGLFTFGSDRFGTRWAFASGNGLVATAITDGQGVTLGSVPLSQPINAVTLSEDGQSLYAAVWVSGALKYQRWDLSNVAQPTLANSVPAAFGVNDRSLFLTPQQDQVVNCGLAQVQGAAP